MNKQEAIEYNVETLDGYLDVTLNGSHWSSGRLPYANDITTRVFGIVDANTARLESMFSRDPPKVTAPYVRTEITVRARHKAKGIIRRAIYKLKNMGRKTHQIIDWKEDTEFNEKSELPLDAQEVLQASRDAYNKRHGFIT